MLLLMFFAYTYVSRKADIKISVKSKLSTAVLYLKNIGGSW